MKRRLSLIIILFLAFAARTFAIFFLGKNVTPEPYEYNVLALNILHGKGYIYDFLNTEQRTFCYPGYSYLIAFFHWITHENYFVLEMFQVAVSVIACGIIYLIAKKIFDDKVALVAAFLAALHPGLIIYTTKIHDLSFVVLLISLILWLIISLNPDKAGHNILIGALIGLGTLTRPTLIFFISVYFFYHWFSSKSRKNYLTGCATVLICAVLVLTPWTIRNYKIHKRFIFITTTSAEQFWRGNNALASGTSFTQNGKTMAEIAPKEFLDKLYKMNEIEQYDFLYHETFKFIASHPAFFVKITLKKFYYFWWFSPQTGLLYPGLWTQLYKPYYIAIFSLFALGVYLGIKRSELLNRMAIISILLFMLFISSANSLYYVESRHRWAVEPFMLIFSSYAIMSLRRAFLKKS